MKGFIFFWLTVAPTFSFEQTLSIDLWHNGKIVVDGGDTIKGLIKYDLQDLIQLRHANQLESFSAEKVLFFEIFDQSNKHIRQFFSLPFAKSGQYKTPIFFELLSKGKLTLLSREKVEARTTASGHIYYPPKIRLSLTNNYFLLKEDGNIESHSGKKKSWYQVMGSKANEVNEFVKSSKLDFKNKYDLQRIIDYYNSFFIR